MTDNYAKDCGCGQRNCNKGWITYNGSEYPCDGPKKLPASFFITNDTRAAAQHCWVVVASTRQGTYNHRNHFSDKAEAEYLLDRCRAAGRINLTYWSSCELQG